MVRGMTNRIAKTLAIPPMVIVMTSQAIADSMILPQQGSDPIVLPVSADDLARGRQSDLLEVFVGSAETCCEGRTPMAGRYTLTDEVLKFMPAFGFDPGQDYVVRLGPTANEPKLLAFRIPLESRPSLAAVTATYPSGDVLPENVLRFYIHFATPMTPQVAFDYIKLLDADGKADEAAFMRFKQELWNEDRTRLTVLIDPGRIKREVATNVALGPALLAGQRYTLSVEGGWPSADGRSVLPPFVKSFTVSPALRERPDVKLWQATAPCVGTTDPLHIIFDRPFDRHLLNSQIQVITEDGQDVDGVVHVGASETSWSFTPNEAWTQNEFTLFASIELEDVAGNNFRDLLDHLQTTDDADVATSTLLITLNGCSQ